MRENRVEETVFTTKKEVRSRVKGKVIHIQGQVTPTFIGKRRVRELNTGGKEGDFERGIVQEDVDLTLVETHSSNGDSHHEDGKTVQIGVPREVKILIETVIDPVTKQRL